MEAELHNRHRELKESMHFLRHSNVEFRCCSSRRQPLGLLFQSVIKLYYHLLLFGTSIGIFSDAGYATFRAECWVFHSPVFMLES
jgi:hypothetical protein